jgi:N-methylhydantoinase B
MAGASGRVVVIRQGETAAIDGNKTDELELHAGDAVLVEVGGGGGYGSPRERPVEDVLRDVRRGYVSAESALRDYGVEILPGGTARRSR